MAKITSNINVKKKKYYRKKFKFSEKDNSIILEKNLKIKNGLFFSLGSLNVTTFKKK